MKGRTTAVLLVAVVALGAMTGIAAADGDLAVSVDDTGDEPVVNVTDNGTAVENATVNVSVVDAENESYAGTGEYETDANGTVALPAPEEDVTVNVTAASDNETASAENVPLEAPADGLALDVSNTSGEPVVTVTDNDTAVENASVNVTTADGQNATYDGEGSYDTDENGTVTLVAADENVTIDVTAEHENASATATADLTASEEGEEDQPFGLQVQEFIESLQDREGGIGAAVSDFVTENNPGNAPDHAGGPNDAAGNASDASGNESDAPGNAPDHAGQGNDGEQGPPDHAGNGDDADGETEDGAETADDEDEGDDDDDDNGAGNGNGNRNGNGNGPNN
ncbi:MAG: hypothetical protein R6U01_14280 [Halorubrum sp.]|uniref:hypothetical protein n=1 Tax=Halorubrum sp. TaxID=1879286 RepID=UPI0039708B71